MYALRDFWPKFKTMRSCKNQHLPTHYLPDTSVPEKWKHQLSKYSGLIKINFLGAFFLGAFIFPLFFPTWQYHRIPISHQYSYTANHHLPPKVIRAWLVRILNPGLILFFILIFFVMMFFSFLLFLYLLKIQAKRASIIAIHNKVYGFLSPWES